MLTSTLGYRARSPWIRMIMIVGAMFLEIGSARADSAGPRRTTSIGAVEGLRLETGVEAYLGIPFAAPPVGNLRWKAPQVAARWRGVREAKAFGPVPVQSSFMDSIVSNLGPQSEDCLYLNVWTPAHQAGQRLPVMVWIHGGGFVAGATSQPVFNGARLASKGVVVVSIAYRVGVMGFLAHPELSREGGGSSGNYGLLDQISGLRWVRDNADVFGGDRSNVTIFGESAGGISTSMLAASPAAKGLFAKVISQSGGSFGSAKFAQEGGLNVRPLSVAEGEGKEYFETIGAKDLAAARAMPATAVVRPGDWWPVFDGTVIKGDQYGLYVKGQFNDTPVLIGTNSDEGALFARPDVTPEVFINSIRLGYGDFADALLSVYPHGNNAEAYRSTKDIFRDSALAWHTWAWARLQAGHGRGEVFAYYLDHRTPQMPGGTSHAADLSYVFGNSLRGPQGPVHPEDAAVSSVMQDYWVNFARTGNPNGQGLPRWSAFTTRDQRMLMINDSPVMISVPNLDQLQVLDRYFAWRRATPTSRIER